MSGLFKKVLVVFLIGAFTVLRFCSGAWAEGHFGVLVEETGSSTPSLAYKIKIPAGTMSTSFSAGAFSIDLLAGTTTGSLLKLVDDGYGHPSIPITSINLPLITDYKVNGSSIVDAIISTNSLTYSLDNIVGWPVDTTLVELGYLSGATSNLQAQISSLTVSPAIPVVATDPTSTSVGAWVNSANSTFNVLAAGGVWSWGSGSFTPFDAVPAAFSFTDITNATFNTLYTSDAITISAIDSRSTPAVSITGGTYQKNNTGAFTASTGTAVLNDTIKVQQTSSGSGNTATNTVLTVGTVSDTYTTTTEANAVVTFGEEIQRYGVTNSNSTTVVTLTSAVSAGSRLVVVNTSGSVAQNLSSVSDSKGNTWVVDKQLTVSTYASMDIASAYIASALSINDTVTLTWSATNYVAKRGALFRVANAANTTVDQTASHTAYSTAATASATTTTANTCIIGGLYAATGTATSPSMTISGAVHSYSSKNNYYYYDVNTSAGSQDMAATIGNNQTYGMIWVAYK